MHVTSLRPLKKQQPSLCPERIFREYNSFLMKTLSFVSDKNKWAEHVSESARNMYIVS